MTEQTHVISEVVREIAIPALITLALAAMAFLQVYLDKRGPSR
jgi:hypothetical protein